MSIFTKSIIQQAAIDWLKERGYSYAFDPEVAFDGAVSMLLPKLMRGEVRVKA